MSSDPQPAAAEPNLDSFVLRFVRDGEPTPCGPVPQGAGAAGWHGVIRHVQSNRERAFSRWADAVAFICEYVDVQDHGMQEHGVQENQDEC